MIRRAEENVLITPKEKAQELIYFELVKLENFYNETYDEYFKKMTKVETRMVRDQIRKQLRRISKNVLTKIIYSF